jgi:3-oxoacyl-[acyl-carrier-protein] synthase-3
LGTGRATPPGTLTNADLAARLDTTDEWIVERTGIRSRQVGGTTSSLAAEAAAAALTASGVVGSDLGAIVVATCTPDRLFPSVASTVAGEVGADCTTFDVNGACAGFVHALVAALGWSLADGRPALIVGADTMTSVTDPKDRSTAVLFGDGAAALVACADPASPGGVLAVHGGTDASSGHILSGDHGGTLHMDGRAVFKAGVRAATSSVRVALEQCDLTPERLDLLVPHQANERITQAIASRLRLPASRVMSTLSHVGNTSAASIPQALAVAEAEGRLADGGLVALCGYGAGMTWATTVLRWAR